MAKFITKRPRYIGGKYIWASPGEPAVVELPDDAKAPPDMVPHKGGTVEGEQLKPAFNPNKPVPPSSAQVQSTPTEKGKKGRASDGDPL